MTAACVLLPGTASAAPEKRPVPDYDGRGKEKTTASDVLFTGGREGYFYALDARSGAERWRSTVGGPIAAGPIAYKAKDEQFVAVVAGHSLFAFGLRD